MAKAIIEIRYGFDKFGEPNWTIQTIPVEATNVISHSSSSFGYKGKNKCVEWYKKMLREKGYDNFTIKEIKDEIKKNEIRQNFLDEFRKFKQKIQSKELIPKRVDSVAGVIDG